jgi:serine/threonine-protein kinase RsbW
MRLNIRLELLSRPEDVQLARELVSGVADATGIDPLSVDDIRTAVTEACNNVIQHAYDGATGPLELDLNLEQDALEATVRDHGGGMQPWIRTSQADTLGIGLMVIKALAESVEFGDTSDGGIEVRMRFFTPGVCARDPGDPLPRPAEPFDASEGSISVSIGPVALAGGVLPRLLSAVAARARFSVDRLSDLQIVGDAIAAHAEPSLNGSHLCVRISADPRVVRISVSPLARGGAQRLLQSARIDGLGGVIERLCDEHQVRPRADGTETLVVHMRDNR